MTYIVIGICLVLLIAVVYISAKPISMGIEARRNLKDNLENFEENNQNTSNFNEDEKIIKPTVKNLMKRKFKVSGPYPADTIFLEKNRKKFNVILGMYHDQVLSPIKTLFEYDAINITLGLPFVRISPDHGPNEKMLGKNVSSPLSLYKAISFLERLK